MGVLLCRDYGLGFCANSLALGCDCLVRGSHTSTHLLERQCQAYSTIPVPVMCDKQICCSCLWHITCACCEPH